MSSVSEVRIDLSQPNFDDGPVGSPPNDNWLKVKNIALVIFSFVPLTGTVIGSYSAYQLSKKPEDLGPVTKWEIAEAVTQIFSFLLLPQVIFFTAVGINATYESYQKWKLAHQD